MIQCDKRCREESLKLPKYRIRRSSISADQLWWVSVLTTTNVVSSNPSTGEVYSIQQYVIKSVSDLLQVGGFLRVLRFPPPIKLIATI